MLLRLTSSIALIGSLASYSVAAEPKPLAFTLTFDQAACDKPFTGRVFVMFRTGPASPPAGLNWFRPEPGLAKDVKDWKPGEPLTISGQDISLSQAARGAEAGQILRHRPSWTAISAASTSPPRPAMSIPRRCGWTSTPRRVARLN